MCAAWNFLLLSIVAVTDDDDAPVVARRPLAGLPKSPRPRIKVSPETTQVLGPVDEDGYVNYVAALNLYIVGNGLQLFTMPPDFDTIRA